MLPRDANGLVPGAWRLVHKDKTFSGELGVVPFRNGMSINPVTGHTLARIIAIYGAILYIELVEGARMPEGYSSKVPEAFLAKLQRAPWREPELPPVLTEEEDDEEGEEGDEDPKREEGGAEVGETDPATQEGPSLTEATDLVESALAEGRVASAEPISFDDLKPMSTVESVLLEGRTAPAHEAAPINLETMDKAALIALAKERGILVGNSWTKDRLRTALLEKAD
jgi:hypothetical protein